MADRSPATPLHLTLHTTIGKRPILNAGEHKEWKLTGRPFASRTFANRSPFGASSIARPTWFGVRSTSLNIITLG